MSKKKKMLDELNEAQAHLDKLRNYLLNFTKRGSQGETFVEGEIAKHQMFVNGISLAMRTAGIKIRAIGTNNSELGTIWVIDE